MRRKTGIGPFGLTSTPPALACLAARMVRATSAWVNRAGVRLIFSLCPVSSGIERANYRLAAVVDMDVLDTNVLVTATAQAPVCLDLETMSPH